MVDEERVISRQVAELEERPTSEIMSKSNSRRRFGPTSPTPSKTRMLNVSAGRWPKPKPQQSGAIKLPMLLLPNQEVKKTMTFRLEKQTPGKTSTRFLRPRRRGLDLRHHHRGKRSDRDLEKHWKSAPASSSPKNAASARKQNPAVAAMVKAARKRGPISKEAILRGC